MGGAGTGASRRTLLRLVPAGAAAALAACADRPESAAPDRRGSAGVPAGARAGVERALQERSRALRAGDVPALLRTVDEGAGAFAAAQAAGAAGLAQIGVASWSAAVLRLRPVPQQRARRLRAPAVLADVAVRERLVGEDRAVRWAGCLTLVERSGRWLLAATSDGPTTPGLWDLGPVRLQRRRRALVLASTAAPERAAAVAAVLDEAAQRVDAAWGAAWPRRTVVLVPATESHAAQLLSRRPQDVRPFAAFVAGGGSVPGAGVRIVVQPSEFDRLSATGRSVVLAHELAHVAAHAELGAASALPRWLVEGGADQLARAGRGLDPAALAAPLLALARSGAELAPPADSDFDPGGSGDLQVAYAAAWTLCESIARRHGSASLVRLHRSLAAGTPLPAAVAGLLGEEVPDVLARWRTEVRDGLRSWR